MLRIHEGGGAALLLNFRDHLQGERGLARGFRTINLYHPAARQAADAERDVEAERAGGHHLHVARGTVIAETHDRSLAKLLLDLGERRGQRLFARSEER